MTSLQGQVAVVTGASSGIGEATAKALAQAGASVILAARRVDKLEVLEQHITQAGGKALSIATDVTSRESVTAMITATENAFGPVDILVNNAGIMLLSFLEACKLDEWDSMVDVNIKGVLYGTGAVLPSMIERGRGHIINVSSIAGRKVMPSAAVYAATKYAVRAFSDGLRQELSGKYGIRVTCIEPGLVGTELLEHISDTDISTRMQQVVGNMTVLSPEDIADTIMYAVSAPPHVNVHELLILPTDQ
ncbi:MAG: SDR family oxidoreductase [Deinococcota bacterium]